jgi:hypothetical protein
MIIFVIRPAFSNIETCMYGPLLLAGAGIEPTFMVCGELSLPGKFSGISAFSGLGRGI